MSKFLCDGCSRSLRDKRPCPSSPDGRHVAPLGRSLEVPAAILTELHPRGPLPFAREDYAKAAADVSRLAILTGEATSRLPDAPTPGDVMACAGVHAMATRLCLWAAMLSEAALRAPTHAELVARTGEVPS